MSRWRRASVGRLLLALVGGAGGLLGAACRLSPTSTPAPTTAATVSTPVAALAPQTPPAAVTLLAPIGAGVLTPASLVPTSSARPGLVELVPSHPVVATALDPILLASQQRLFTGRPVGDALGGILREGQAVQFELTLPLGGCYAVVALSPSVVILGLELGAGGQEEPLRVRSSQGVASLGVAACVPLPAGLIRLRLIAVSGAGPAVARLFVR